MEVRAACKLESVYGEEASLTVSNDVSSSQWQAAPRVSLRISLPDPHEKPYLTFNMEI